MSVSKQDRIEAPRDADDNGRAKNLPKKCPGCVKEGFFEWIVGFELDVEPEAPPPAAAPSATVGEVAAARIRSNAETCNNSSGIHPRLAWRMGLASVAAAALVARARRVSGGSGGGGVKRLV